MNGCPHTKHTLVARLSLLTASEHDIEQYTRCALSASNVMPHTGHCLITGPARWFSARALHLFQQSVQQNRRLLSYVTTSTPHS
jgi:hypothetical protein